MDVKINNNLEVITEQFRKKKSTNWDCA